MKKFRLLAALSALFILAIGAVSCSKDDNGAIHGSLLFGTWVRNIDETEDGVRYIIHESYRFNNDGTGVHKSEVSMKVNSTTTTMDPVSETFKYTYSEKDEMLLITFDGNSQAKGYNVQLTGNTLMLTQTQNGTVVISTFEKK